MAVDEAARLRLYQKARDTWGDDEAGTLMDSLPRDPDNLATKDDLANGLSILEANLRGEIADVRGEVKGSQAEIIRTLMFTIIASNATLVGLVFAAVKLG